MSCNYSSEYGRYLGCDSRHKCYCPHCKKCGEAVGSKAELDKNEICKWCIKKETAENVQR